jgi:histidyl-tRNA synthetase
MGDVVLGELLAGRHTAAASPSIIKAFLVAVTSEDVAHVLALAHRLRDRGIAVEYALKPQSVGKQLKLAAARGAPYAVIVGPDERAAGAALVRELMHGSETRVPFEELDHAL